MSDINPQHILELKAENVKCLKAVRMELTHEGQLVIVGGRNGQGKSSLLDSVQYVLTGKKALPDLPVRNGEKEAKVHIETEDFIFDYRIKTDRSGTVTITGKDGGKYGSPATLLRELTNSVCFDPLEFMRLGAKEKAASLAAHIGLDLDAFDRAYKSAFDHRTMINRDVKRLESLIESIPALTKADREVKSASDLMRELRAAESHNQEIEKNESRLSDLRAIIKSSRSDIEEWTNLIKKEKLKINELISEGKALQEVLKSSHVIDTDQIESAIENAEAVADSVAKMRQREAAQAELKDAKAKSESLSSKLEKLKLDKAEKIRSAKLPYDGLDFGENGLLLNDVPLEQINDAEKLKICTSIGIASNPKVRAIFIRNGSLLDDDGMKILAEIAKKNDMHIWIERVGDKDKCAIVLEDGEAKE